VPEFEFSPTAQQWVNVILIWLGFGLLAGLLARALVPGRHTVGAVATLVIGVLGSTIGLLGLSYLLQGRPLNPISPVGLLAAAAGAFVLLVLYRVFIAWTAPGEDDIEPDEEPVDEV
jgi:uncharacterized membrane protein YeaQ/YmgE (transglycosylase-associated protein family)